MGEREYPSLFDGDDAVLGLVDRSAWVIDNGSLRAMPGQEEQEKR